MTRRTILLTGATGYLGRKLGVALADRLTGRPDRRLVLWVRAQSADEANLRAAPLVAALNARQVPSTVAWGDLAAAAPFAGVDPGTVNHIVHTAAITQFGVARAAAAAVNVAGTGKLLEFARQCPHLDSATIASTLYVAGLQPGPIAAAPLARPRAFANAYEESKWLAETLVVENFADLPWRIIRLPTIIADDASGAIGQQNAVHHALRLLLNGLLPVVPGDPTAPLFFASADEIVAPMARLIATAPAHSVVNLVPDAGAPATLGQVMTAAHDAFGAAARYRARVPAVPPWCGLDAFTALADAAGRFSTDLTRQAYRAIAPFVRQLYVHHTVATDGLAAGLPAGPPLPRGELVGRVCHHLVDTSWRTAA